MVKWRDCAKALPVRAIDAISSRQIRERLVGRVIVKVRHPMAVVLQIVSEVDASQARSAAALDGDDEIVGARFENDRRAAVLGLIVGRRFVGK
jgi:hypothetical protein